MKDSKRKDKMELGLSWILLLALQQNQVWYCIPVIPSLRGRRFFSYIASSRPAWENLVKGHEVTKNGAEAC